MLQQMEENNENKQKQNKAKESVAQAAALTHSCGLCAGVGGALSSQVLSASLSNSNNCGCSATVYSFISLFGHASSAFLTLPNEMTSAHAHAARKASVKSMHIHTPLTDDAMQRLLMAVYETLNDS